MDFRFIVLLLSLWLSPAWANTMTRLDDLATKIYQYPSETLSALTQLEQADASKDWTIKQQLKFALLKCEAYVQLGENEAAINLARLNDAKAGSEHIDQASPYFLNCMAAAYLNYGDIRHALALLDKAIFQSRELQQAPSLVNGLILRARISIQIDDEDNALEDLRLAQDIYPDTEQQTDWVGPPQAFIQLTMAKLLQQKGELNPAFYLAKHAIKHPQVAGKIKLAVLLDAAKIAHLNQEFSFRDDTILEAKTLIPELASATELAEYYTQLAELEFLRDNHKSAIQLLTIALDTFKKHKKIHQTLRASRLLAQLHLADKESDTGLEMMQQAIAIAQRSNHYDELVTCYQILSDYYVGIDDFRQAYQYQLKRFDSAQKRDEQLKGTRLQQVKTQLSHYQQKLQQELTQPDSQIPKIDYVYFIIAGLLLLLILITLFILIARAKPKSTLPGRDNRESLLSLTEKMDILLSTAKQLDVPLTLLQINVSAMAAAEVNALMNSLKDKLRQQDLLLHNRGTNILIMLPFTSEAGAKGLVKQLEELISLLPRGNKLPIGMAFMRQHDTLSSLIKRANVDQLSRYNEKRAAD